MSCNILNELLFVYPVGIFTKHCIKEVIDHGIEGRLTFLDLILVYPEVHAHGWILYHVSSHLLNNSRYADHEVKRSPQVFVTHCNRGVHLGCDYAMKDFSLIEVTAFALDASQQD